MAESLNLIGKQLSYVNPPQNQVMLQAPEIVHKIPTSPSVFSSFNNEKRQLQETSEDNEESTPERTSHLKATLGNV